MKDFPVQTFYKNQVIFEEGTPANIAYILKAGRVELSIQGKQKIILAELKPGDIFGETALLLKEGRRTETAVALEESELIVIYKTAFQEYLEQSPPVISKLVNGMAERQQATASRLLDTADLIEDIGALLKLLLAQGVTTIVYEPFIQSASEFFRADPSEVAERLRRLEKLNHFDFMVDIEGRKVIKLPEPKSVEGTPSATAAE